MQEFGWKVDCKLEFWEADLETMIQRGQVEAIFWASNVLQGLR